MIEQLLRGDSAVFYLFSELLCAAFNFTTLAYESNQKIMVYTIQNAKT